MPTDPAIIHLLHISLKTRCYPSRVNFTIVAIGLETLPEISESPQEENSGSSLSSSLSDRQRGEELSGVVVSESSPCPILRENTENRRNEAKLRSAIAAALFWHNYNNHINKQSITSTASSVFQVPLTSGYWLVIMCKLAVLALAFILILTFVLSGERNAVEASGYRKPPFNGSIFGKRTASGTWFNYELQQYF